MFYLKIIICSLLFINYYQLTVYHLVYFLLYKLKILILPYYDFYNYTQTIEITNKKYFKRSN